MIALTEGTSRSRLPLLVDFWQGCQNARIRVYRVFGSLSPSAVTTDGIERPVYWHGIEWPDTGSGLHTCRRLPTRAVPPSRVGPLHLEYLHPTDLDRLMTPSGISLSAGI